MSEKIIEKPKSYFKLPPSLEDYEKTYQSFKWSKGKQLNAAYDAIDRHAKSARKNKIALYWESEDGSEAKYTFQELFSLSNRFANVLKRLGVKRGERVFFFLPRIPELYFGFLGTLKRGAIAGTLFAAFGTQGLLDRLGSSGAKVLVTTPELKKRVDKIRDKLPRLQQIILVDEENRRNFLEERLKGWSLKKKGLALYQELAKVDDDYKAAKMKPTDPAFILYTSGTTGKPKGVVHTHQSIIQQHMTAKWVLDIHEEDVYWCTADPGWVTGIAYGILGTWSCGAATVVYEGRFDPGKWYSILEEYKVSVWYTAPTAIRMLAAAGSNLVKKYNLSSLRHLCSVGEPLNPEAVFWGLKAFGLPFHDNYWQTETGGIVIANYPSMPIKPGSMGKPVPGVEAAIVDDKGSEVKPGVEGDLALKPTFPSLMKTIWRRPKKYDSYFRVLKGPALQKWYITEDRAYVDKDGYFWFVGRADDVIKTAGERVGPFEVESALMAHPAVVEAGVIGKPDPIRGEIIKAFVVPARPGLANLEEKLKKHVKKTLAGHAYPREIEFVDKLPKTRSGKIVRRILKAKEMGLPVGDVSTLEEY